MTTQMHQMIEQRMGGAAEVGSGPESIGPWRLATAVRIESLRFKMSPAWRAAFDLVNELTSGAGRAEFFAEVGVRSLVVLSSISRADHLKRALDELVLNGVLLPLCPAEGRIRLAINFDFEGWRCTVLRSREAHWRAVNGARREAGLAEWLVKPELDLNGALAVTHRERFVAALVGGAATDAPVMVTEGVSRGRTVPDSGLAPESGADGKRWSERRVRDVSPMESRVSCANANAGGVERARARARVDNCTFVKVVKPLSMPMSREELKLAISDGLEPEWCAAARQIVGARDWDDGRAERFKGDGAQWRLRRRHKLTKDVAISVMLEMIEKDLTGGGVAKRLWKEFGGEDLDKERFSSGQKSTV